MAESSYAISTQDDWRKIGTGGSSGYKYLKDTAANHTIFSDFSNLSTFIIPRSQLPILPSELIEKLGFHLTYGK